MTDTKTPIDIHILAAHYIGEVSNAPRIRGRAASARVGKNAAIAALCKTEQTSDMYLAALAREVKSANDALHHAEERVAAQNARFDRIKAESATRWNEFRDECRKLMTDTPYFYLNESK
jgi:hypothetical protein